jgi:hypothetical protein
MMKIESRITVSHPAIVYSTRRWLGWRAATLALTALSQLPTSVVWATINAGTTTVTSIGHSFEPENPTPNTGHPAVVTDFLVNQTQEVGGGAVLPAVTVNLDVDTSISYTLSAPAGKKFVVHLPAGSAANMSLSLAWQTGAFDFGTSAPFNASFQNLVGVAPSFSSNSIVGANNQSFDFASSTPVFSNDLSFTSVTFTTTYDPRTLGQGPLTYQPAGSIAPFGTTARNANFTISYATSGAVDPGHFVSLVPLLRGDYNGDGSVDASDFIVWRKSVGSTTNLAADGNGNGVIDNGDFDVWRAHFGQTAGTESDLNTRAAVPEPTSIALMIGLGGSALAMRRRACFSAR